MGIFLGPEGPGGGGGLLSGPGGPLGGSGGGIIPTPHTLIPYSIIIETKVKNKNVIRPTANPGNMAPISTNSSIISTNEPNT